MNVEEETLRRVMREEINRAMDDKLDTRFTDFEKKIDSKLDARFASFEKKLDSKIDARFDDFETKLAKFFGDTHHYFDKRFNKFEKKFDKKFNAMQTSIDGIMGRLDDDDVERAAIGVQLDRHETNLGELAKHTGARLTAA